MSKTDATTKTKVTRPAAGTATDDKTAAEVAANTADSNGGEETGDEPDDAAKEAAAPPARSRPKPSAGSGFKPPFTAEGTAVTDSQGLLVCRAGAEHLETDQRCDVATWIAETLSVAS